MIKIDIISGFLGAGKTTLINRLIREAYKGEKVVLIENEFGEIGIDGGFLKEAGVEITEMNSGCICCSLVGDFSEALKKVASDYTPDRIIIEPSGVGKLSDVTKAVASAELEGAVINSAVVVVDVNKCKMYMKNFGEFFNDQIEHAGCIFFSHTDKTTDAKLSEAIVLVREHNASAELVTTPADKLDISTVISAFERTDTLDHLLKELTAEEICPECGHHHEHHHEHHHHDHDECDCHEHHEHHEHHHHHDHHDHEECDCHEHHEHHHHHDHEECECHEHHHHHDHEECDCHDHHHHHHHHADEVFTSWGKETVVRFTEQAITDALAELENEDKYGFIIRAKGIVEGTDGRWIYFDYVPGEPDVRFGSASNIGKICVIGSKIDENALQALFGV